MEINHADYIYRIILKEILTKGDKLTTRNAEVYSSIDIPTIRFKSAPLVQIRKTAWKKALYEMEWFLSGKPRCPDELVKWWEGQLDENGQLLDGYSMQFRAHTMFNYKTSDIDFFDQIAFLQDALKANPNSRRLLLTSWNPGEMAYITETNNNPNTPTTCHNTMTQFFVRDNALHMKTYQRSADMLLGVPHNWVQSWAMLTWFAYNAGLSVGHMQWTFGDAHIYNEESHLEAAEAIIKSEDIFQEYKLVYRPTGDSTVFTAADFHIEGTIAEPLVLTRPKLL